MPRKVFLATPYAKAAFLSSEIKDKEHFLQFLKELSFIVKSDMVAAYLKDSLLKSEEKAETLIGFFTDIDCAYKNFIKLLIENEKIFLIDKVLMVYKDYLATSKNEKHVTLTVAKDIDENLLDRIKQEISSAYAAQVVLDTKSNSNLVVGGRLKVQDDVIDNSLSSILTSLHMNLTD